VHRFRYFPRRWENLTHEEAAREVQEPMHGKRRPTG